MNKGKNKKVSIRSPKLFVTAHKKHAKRINVLKYIKVAFCRNHLFLIT